MNQNELAELLGISPTMVSKLKKRGMPTDSLERAQRWRKRHLEPGRVKQFKMPATSGVQIDPVFRANILSDACDYDLEGHLQRLKDALRDVPPDRLSEVIFSERVRLEVMR